MKKIKQNTILLLLLLVMQTLAFAGDKTSFNKGWKFIKEGEILNHSLVSQTNFNDADWESVNLPHTTNLEPLVVNNQWQGISWYRKSFSIKKEEEQKQIFLEFEGAMNIAEIWVNGKFVKKHLGGYLPIVADISSFVEAGKQNIIVIRLDNTDSDVTGPKPLRILDFNTYGGLYRNVWMIVKDPVHITLPLLEEEVAGGGVFIRYPEVSKSSATISIQTDIKNTYKKEVSISLVQELKWKGKTIKKLKSKKEILSAGKKRLMHQSMVIKNPKLWNTYSPNLYQLETKILINGKVTDHEVTTIGIKSVEFKGKELYINGEKRYVKGVNRHQEYPFVGYALSDQAEIRDAVLIKNAGFDVIRLSHYPHSPAFMNACDSLGLLTIDAILGWQYYQPTEAFRNQIFQTARDLIRRDRNHANVLLWEVSLNETKMPLEFREKLSKIVEEEYPKVKAYSAGWMDEGYDVYFQARQHRILHPETEGKWKGPYFVSEYGDWEYYSKNAGLNQHKLDKQTRYETSSRQSRAYGEKRLLQQAYNVQEALNDNLNTSAFGDGYWVMFDYNRGYHSDLEFSGLSDIFRIPKFAYYFYQSQREYREDKDAVVKIASYWNENSPLDVKVYSNCDQVVLSLNGEEIAIQTADKNKNSSKLSYAPFTFKVNNFVAGELKAEGYKDGKLIKIDRVKTAKKASQLRIKLAENTVAVGNNDLIFAYIEVVDEEGTIVHDFADTIDVRLAGDVALMNVGEVQVEAGIATALLKVNSLDQGLSIQALSKKTQLKGSFQYKENE
ncbi:sugar-binding domain-containing protein [Flammeovirga sp. SubArs3]|uniref:sugar-binding domain-containing protein n=1 Tax=Flammeovirga sp. SubArs3 TaxID=2995316 RepID=UPI00248C1FCC|nr:sugar-binding domain-containing protein [Flammeovirga sp. SubArs3]